MVNEQKIIDFDQIKDGGYLAFPNHFVFNHFNEFKASELKVFQTILNWTLGQKVRKESCTFYIGYLSKRLGLCYRTVHRAIGLLEDKGFISIRRTLGTFSEYTILPMKLIGEATFKYIGSDKTSRKSLRKSKIETKSVFEISEEQLKLCKKYEINPEKLLKVAKKRGVTYSSEDATNKLTALLEAFKSGELDSIYNRMGFCQKIFNSKEDFKNSSALGIRKEKIKECIQNYNQHDPDRNSRLKLFHQLSDEEKEFIERHGGVHNLASGSSFQFEKLFQSK